MKIRKTHIAVLISFLLTASACGKKETPATTDTSTRIYTTIALQPSVEAKEISLPAELKPFESVKIYSRVAGYVRKIYVDMGDRVSAGQLLAEIDAPEQQMRLSELNERMQTAYTQYLSSKDEYDRAIQLAKSPDFISKAEIIRLTNKKLADSLSWEATQFSRRNVQEMVNYLKIRSPFAGVVTARHVDAGELVGADNRQHLLEIEDNSRLRLEVAVPETYSTATLQGKQATFTVPSMPGRDFKATFARRGNTLTETTKSEVWQFDFPNPGNRLKSGMYANIKMKLVRSDSTFVVPSNAIVSTLEKQYVIRIEADTARFIPIKTGFVFKDRTEVFGQLFPGDIIVQPASEQVKEGGRVITKPLH
ncbi:MAG: efflux RND transporter periplasmic adaptor subunit [Saprospiraceae bacterium]|nr:efflux RND transporter periplasmic adaptor subunit [Saprospiraceae bacterium]